MQLVTISPSPHPPKVWLKFSDDSLLPFKLDDVVSLGIKKLTDLDEDILNKIYFSSLRYILLEYALRQVAISPKVKKVLLPKLNQKLRYYISKYQYPDLGYQSIIEETLAYLGDHQLLDSRQYSSHIIHKYKNKSRREIDFILQSQGIKVSADTIPSDREKIVHLIQKKMKTIGIVDVKQKNKLISALARKGFAIGEVKSVIDDLTKP